MRSIEWASWHMHHGCYMWVVARIAFRMFIPIGSFEGVNSPCPIRNQLNQLMSISENTRSKITSTTTRTTTSGDTSTTRTVSSTKAKRSSAKSPSVRRRNARRVDEEDDAETDSGSIQEEQEQAQEPPHRQHQQHDPRSRGCWTALWVMLLTAAILSAAVSKALSDSGSTLMDVWDHVYCGSGMHEDQERWADL